MPLISRKYKSNYHRSTWWGPHPSSRKGILPSGYQGLCCLKNFIFILQIFCIIFDISFQPSNMMILPHCRIKVIDFDTAKVCLGKYTSKSLVTFNWRTSVEYLDNDYSGTYPYFPPECVAQVGYGRSIDWLVAISSEDYRGREVALKLILYWLRWAVGVTVYQLATGRLPWTLRTTKAMLEHIMTCSYRWPFGNFSKPLVGFVSDLLQKRIQGKLLVINLPNNSDNSKKC